MIEKINEMLANKMKEEKTIYVLRGFNSIFSKLNFPIEHIFNINLDKDLNNINKLEKGFFLKEFVTKIADNTKSYYCLFEEMLLSEKSIDIFANSDYQVIVIDLNCFDYYYPSFPCDANSKLLDEINEENDYNNNIQKIYSEFEIRNGTPIVVYNGLNNENYKFINLIDSYKVYYDNYNYEITKEEKIYDNSLSEMFVQVFNDVFEEKCNTINYTKVEGRDNTTINKYLSILNILGVNIIQNTKKTNFDIPALYNEYLKILKRRNPSWDFLSLEMYKDPFKSNEIIEINQSVIIDTIYQNIIKAKKKESFRDIFVTAPTGAGKSILFQIPAIMAAEKENLVTIIISPLIGLMKDQVNNIGDMTDCAATINSEFSPIEKENIKDRIKKGEISILYISPEALLSYSDIKTFIGERDIGLLVVDEAHTVATWGKNFRPDYWYLGDYLDKLRHDKTNKYIFPIATFTATATLSQNNNDMYHDIIESLNMTCDSFFGSVRRKNIIFDIEARQKHHAYREEKNNIVAERIDKYATSNEKTIVYFPYVRTLKEFYENSNKKNKLGRYYGDLDKFDKDDTLEDIRFGNKNVVLATKAFGMGIDVTDIKNVYHFAPTGNLADYVQEIGRAARDSKMIGVASTDFFEEDFKYIKQLYGMSQITNYNIIGVLKKIEDKYKKENKRNFMVSVDEFAHVFRDDDEDNIENKLKATIIAIKKDFRTMSSFIPLIFKPRSMFTKGLFWINNNDYEKVKEEGLDPYVERRYSKGELKRLLDDYDEEVIYSGDIYDFDFKRCWQDHFNGKYDGITFGNFKRKFYLGELNDSSSKIKIDKNLFKDRSVLTLDSKRNNKLEYVSSKLSDFLNALKEVLDDIKISRKQYLIEEICTMMEKKEQFINRNRLKNSMEPLLTLLIDYDIKKHGFGYKFCEYNKKTQRYKIMNNNYDKDISEIKYSINRYTEEYGNEMSRKSIISIENDSSQMRTNPLLIGVQMLELLDLATYTFEAGNRPEYFIRVNSESTILKVINNDFYQSKTLKAIQDLHYDSMRYMKYFFTKLNTDEERWDFIEDYFLGRVEEKYKIPKDLKSDDIDEDNYNDEKQDTDKIAVYQVIDTVESDSTRYYISDDEIDLMKEKGYHRISKETELAKQLKKAKCGEVFSINQYEYLLEQIEYFDL